MQFSQVSIPESLVKKFITDKVIQHLLKVTTPTEYKKYMVSTNVEYFVNCESFFTKLSGIDPCEKRINILDGHAWGNVFTVCSKLVAMANYVVKQAFGYYIIS